MPVFLNKTEDKTDLYDEIEEQICLLRINLNATDEKIRELKQAMLCDEELVI